MRATELNLEKSLWYIEVVKQEVILLSSFSIEMSL